MACARSLETEILRIGPESVAAFFAEPIVGSTVGALHPPKEYWPIVREICSKYDVLLVADEIMTGMGRTETLLHPALGRDAGHHLLGESPFQGIRRRGGHDRQEGNRRDHPGRQRRFQHGHTYNGNPVTAAAVTATIRYMKKNNVFENAAERGRQFDEKIPALLEIPIVGEVRGMGMMRGVELVADKKTKAPFPASLKAAAFVTESA